MYGDINEFMNRINGQDSIANLKESKRRAVEKSLFENADTGSDVNEENADYDTGDNGEIILAFEDKADAENLYDFLIDMGILDDDEVSLKNSKGETMVVFEPSVLVSNPEVIQVAMLAYESQLDADNDDDVDAFESIISDLTDALNGELTEAKKKRTPGSRGTLSVAGVPKASRGNPWHNKNTGFFDSPRTHIRQSGGSWSDGMRKAKFSKKGKTKGGGLVAKYGATRNPCGRAARAMGKNIRCWDGAEVAARRTAKVVSKRRRNESITVGDYALIMEMRLSDKIKGQAFKNQDNSASIMDALEDVITYNASGNERVLNRAIRVLRSMPISDLRKVVSRLRGSERAVYADSLPSDLAKYFK